MYGSHSKTDDRGMEKGLKMTIKDKYSELNNTEQGQANRQRLRFLIRRKT
jgi:hypothetical protein